MGMVMLLAVGADTTRGRLFITEVFNPLFSVTDLRKQTNEIPFHQDSHVCNTFMSGHSLDNTVHVKRFESEKYLYIVLSKYFYIFNVCLHLPFHTYRYNIN